jgi:hypothetical protein
LEEIEMESHELLAKGKAAQFVDRGADSRGVARLIERLQAAVVHYQVSKNSFVASSTTHAGGQISLPQTGYNQIIDLTVSSTKNARRFEYAPSVNHHHRPNPVHSQAMLGFNQLAASRNARRVEYPPGVYIQCDTGTFAGRTIRAEMNEVQKANVGRKYVFFRHALSATQPGPLPLFFETQKRPASL